MSLTVLYGPSLVLLGFIGLYACPTGGRLQTARQEAHLISDRHLTLNICQVGCSRAADVFIVRHLGEGRAYRPALKGHRPA